MDKTFIEKLQQIERVKLYDLLCDNSIWKSLDINYHPPHVERLWCQVGKYRIYLHFLHPCKDGEALYHPHPWPSAIHVLEGGYETGLGFGPGIEPPELLGKVIVPNGGMYYDMTHKDGWHYVKPIDVCSSVMLVGEPWDREQVAKERKELMPLHMDRVHVMLEYFKVRYQHTVKTDDILEDLKRGDWVSLDEGKMDRDDREEYGMLIGKKGFVIKNTQNDGLSIRFENDRYDEFNPKVLMKLDKPEE